MVPKIMVQVMHILVATDALVCAVLIMPNAKRCLCVNFNHVITLHLSQGLCAAAAVDHPLKDVLGKQFSKAGRSPCSRSWPWQGARLLSLTQTVH